MPAFLLDFAVKDVADSMVFQKNISNLIKKIPYNPYYFVKISDLAIRRFVQHKAFKLLHICYFVLFCN